MLDELRLLTPDQQKAFANHALIHTATGDPFLKHHAADLVAACAGATHVASMVQRLHREAGVIPHFAEARALARNLDLPLSRNPLCIPA